MHTWYDTVCTKEYWLKLLDDAGARRPLQLGAWDGGHLADVGPGIGFGKADLVCKISDSYLGIGDRLLKRGKDFSSREEVEATLLNDPEYKGKAAVLAEFIRPTETLTLSSKEYGAVHSLDIVTMRTSDGVKVLTVLLWTDCDGWSSHSTHAGYLVDVDTETVTKSAAWYSPFFAAQEASLVGTHLPGVREACAKAVAAHELSNLPWLATVGWDAMLTDEGAVFFEGNVAAYRTPRRMFLSPAALDEFFAEYRNPAAAKPKEEKVTASQLYKEVVGAAA